MDYVKGKTKKSLIHPLVVGCSKRISPASPTMLGKGSKNELISVLTSCEWEYTRTDSCCL